MDVNTLLNMNPQDRITLIIEEIMNGAENLPQLVDMALKLAQESGVTTGSLPNGAEWKLLLTIQRNT